MKLSDHDLAEFRARCLRAVQDHVQVGLADAYLEALAEEAGGENLPLGETRASAAHLYHLATVVQEKRKPPQKPAIKCAHCGTEVLDFGSFDLCPKCDKDLLPNLKPADEAWKEMAKEEAALPDGFLAGSPQVQEVWIEEPASPPTIVDEAYRQEKVAEFEPFARDPRVGELSAEDFAKVEGPAKPPEPKLTIEILEAALGPANRMDAPDGPQCACGKPSRHQSGWCGECQEPSVLEAVQFDLEMDRMLDDVKEGRPIKVPAELKPMVEQISKLPMTDQPDEEWAARLAEDVVKDAEAKPDPLMVWVPDTLREVATKAAEERAAKEAKKPRKKRS